MTALWRDWIDKVAATEPDEFHFIPVDPGEADDFGAQSMQAAADKAGRPVLVLRGSVHHEGRIYWPRELVEADRPPPGLRRLRESLTVPQTKRRVLESHGRVKAARSMRDRIKTNPS